MRLCVLLAAVACVRAVRLAPMGVRPTVRASCRMDLFADLKRGFTKLTAGEYDEAAVLAKVKQDISRKPCIMYSLSTCPFCAKAKEALDGMGAMYTIVEFDEAPDGWATKAELSTITGQTSAPQVFVGGEFVGGCNDGGMGGVLPLKKSGKLASMLSQAGALPARI